MESDMTDKFTHPKDAGKGHKWQDADGTPVDDLHYFEGANGVYTIYATIGGAVKGFSDSGMFNINSIASAPYRLIDAPVEREVWVNLDEDGCSASFWNKEDADDFANFDRIACQKFTITEGEFDDEK